MAEVVKENSAEAEKFKAEQPTVTPVESVKLNKEGTEYSERIIVTGTRHQQKLLKTDTAIGSLAEYELEHIGVKHAADALNRIPGVYIAQLGSTGEGAAAAIRQPISYGPSYLYLENGVPVRSAAFYNHNALYEMNVPQASGVEVVKGPGTALHGSDAIGGIVNVLVGQMPSASSHALTLQSSTESRNEFAYRGALESDASRITWRFTAVDDAGWREHTASTRQSLLASYQSSFGGDWEQLSWFSHNQLDLETGGSGLSLNDFKSSPELAGNLIGFRKVSSSRFASRLSTQLDNAELSIIPFFRSNRLEYMATWTLNTGREVFIPWLGRTVLDSQDAHINSSGHDSVGFLMQYRQELGNSSFWLLGLDAEYSDGFQEQTYIVRTDNDPGDYWRAYAKRERLYDYDVTYSALSPYFHSEWQLAEKLRLNAGLRFDYGHYDYKNTLSTVLDSPTHNRPPSQTLSVQQTSPKLGLVYQINTQNSAYVSFREAFRIPGAYQLFRAGRTVNSSRLSPVEAKNTEFGIRGSLAKSFSYEAALYELKLENDILSYTDPTSGARSNINAGETSHVGLELGLRYQFSEVFKTQFAFTRAKHKYQQWQVSDTLNFNGNNMPNAPEETWVAVLDYSPAWLQGGNLSVEWQRIGDAYIDEANSLTREAYNLLHLRGSYYLDSQTEVFGQVLNARDTLYAETTSKWGPSYTPGRPRSVFFGVRWLFE